MLQKELFHYVEERKWVKFQEERQEAWVGQKSDNVINVASPLKRRKRSCRELFSFNKEAHNPENLVPDVRATVFDLKLDLAIMNVFTFLFTLLLCVLFFCNLVSLEDASPLFFDVFGQFQYLISTLFSLVALHQIIQGAKNTEAYSDIIMSLIIELSSQQVYQC